MSYMVDAARVAEVLGVKAKTLGDLSHAVEKGLPKKALSRTTRRVFVERGAARKFLVKVVPEATFKRRIRLTVPESERTERLAHPRTSPVAASRATRVWWNGPSSPAAAK